MKAPRHLRMEENLWSEEALISHIYVKLIFGDGVDAFVFLDPFPGVGVILGELFYNVWADVAVPLLKANKNNQKTDDTANTLRKSR